MTDADRFSRYVAEPIPDGGRCWLCGEVPNERAFVELKLAPMRVSLRAAVPTFRGPFQAVLRACMLCASFIGEAVAEETAS